MTGVDSAELIWIGIVLLAMAFTAAALLDARADRDAVRRRNGRVRTIQTRGNVRREWLRLVTLGVMLGAVITLLPVERVTPTVVLLMAAPLVILVASALDAVDRRALGRVSDDEIVAERSRVEAKLDALAVQGAGLAAQVTVGTVAATAAAGDARSAAFRAETSVTDAAVKAKESFDAAMAAYLSDEPMRATIEDTAEQVHEIHDRVVPPKDES